MRPVKMLTMRAPGKILLAAALAVAGCRQPSSTTGPSTGHTAAATPSAAPAATFVDRVWRVARSTGVSPGTLYAFFDEGTLLVVSAGNKPLVGTWSHAGDGHLVMVEDSIGYRVDVLELTRDSFKIRSHNPGGSVDIELVPADGG